MTHNNFFPTQEDIKSLSTHVVENFGQTVDKVLYVNTFKALRQKYEQQQDRLRTDRSQAPLEKYVYLLLFFREMTRQLLILFLKIAVLDQY